MKYLAEKQAEDFLEKSSLEVVPRTYVTKKSQLSNAIKKVRIPFVMKVAGKKIVHKNKLNGVVTEIKTYSQALQEFKKIKKIKRAQGVLIQKKLTGKEFLIGIKDTPEFGHVLAFGAGGINTEKLKDVSFRVMPIDKKEARKMIKELKSTKKISQKNKLAIEKVLLKISELSEKNPQIRELDINPLMVQEGKATIVDARIILK
jgi:hypothetical protein